MPTIPSLRRLSSHFAAAGIAFLLLHSAASAAHPPIDRTFSADFSTDSWRPHVVAVLDSGPIYVVTQRNNSPLIERLLADGRHDPDFHPPANVGWLLAVFPDGRSLVAQAPYRLAADGMPAPLALPPSFDPEAPLTAALVLPDGKFLVAQGQQLVRLSADGSPDPSFAFQNPYADTIESLQLDAQHRVLLSAWHYVIPGYSDVQRSIVRLLPTGAQDDTFGRVGGYRTRVSVFPLANGDYLTATNFEGGQTVTYTLISASGEGKWGATAPFVDPGLISPESLVVDPAGYAYVMGDDYHRVAITDHGFVPDPTFSFPGIPFVDPDGRLLVAGDFTSLDGHPSSRLARFITGAPYLANLSGRAHAGSGEETVIAGFVTAARPNRTAPLSTLLRGAGPALEPLGVHNVLPNPVIEVFSHGTLIASNDQWDDSLASTADALGAFSFTSHSNDAALLRDVSPGATTVFIRDRDNATGGVGLLEIYRVPGIPSPGEFLNLSFRAGTAPGDATAIAGFVIIDPEGQGRSARVLLRAVGPTLTTQGIAHPLENPVLTVYDAHGAVVARNDDWFLSPASNPSAAADLTAAAKKVGAFDLTTDSHDAALLLNLPAGAYSMHATGGEGVVLLEIYLVP